MRVLSLFSGIGGLDLGLRMAVPSARTVAYCEREPYCVEVLKARMADGRLDTAPVYDDVQRDWTDLASQVDAVVGGFPCQDISSAGNRAGIRPGTRSGLFFDLVRCARDVGARWMFLENVAAIVAGGLDTVLGTLAEFGWDAEWGILRASDVGAPHRRARWFCVAWRRVADANWLRCELAEASRSDGAGGAVAAAGGALADAYRSDGRQWEARRGSRGGTAAGGAGGTLEHAAGAGSQGEAVGRVQHREPLPGRGAVADTCNSRREGQRARGEPAGGDTEQPHAARSGSELADAASVERRCWDESHQSTDREHGDFPPGPADRERWAAILAKRPDLAPTLPAVRGNLDGLPDWLVAAMKDRRKRLAALGNAVVPAQAAEAFRQLLARVS